MTDAAPETFAFEADVGRVLEIVAHALYSDREVFLRELVANASDSCDRLRFAALSQPDLSAGDAYAVTISADAEAGVLTIQDNGFGLNRQDMTDNLGSIARSGAAAFMEAAKAAQAEGGELRQIGQFGVGFYAAFMVADRVRVTARKAGETDLWVWSSDGKGSYAVGPAGADDPRFDGHGARIDLFLKDDATEFLDGGRIEAAVRKRADHIGLPVFWADGEERRQINAGQALWTRAKSDLDQERYAEAFRQFGGFGDPFATLHYRAEGVISFTALLFAPKTPGFDLFDPDRRNRLRLHVKQVFITDDRQDLVPAWLRFMVGVVDSEDLPLNVSRETPQATPVVARMRKTLTGRILDMLKAKAKDDLEGYETFWTAFGPVLKEGLYEDVERRDALLALCRFHSTGADGRTGLEDYIDRMKDGQDAIYYFVGEGAPATLAAAPQLEGFKAKGVEVLLLTDPIDAFWTAAIGEALGKPLKSASQAGEALDAVADAAGADETPNVEPAPGLDALTAALKLALREEVADIRVSRRLQDSPVCLVAAEGGLDVGAERILRRGRGDLPDAAPRVLELNPNHSVVRALAAKLAADGDAFDLAGAGRLLLDQARILDGDAPSDPQAFSRRLESALCAAWTA